jgi:2-polyprenyl-3-methyl-5-hydroxy-6-metoxy-1,4-benzoquinol methylase
MSNVADREAPPAKQAVGREVRRLTGSVQEFLARLVEGKTVLDVGCADHSVSREASDSWLHKHLARSARFILGVDILESEAAELRRRGYNVISGDATTIALDRRFDVVVAGEIIEHVGAPAALVASLARHLNQEGRLALTTPHAFFALHFLESVFCSPAKRWNEQHVTWYCPSTLGNLLRRNGLDVEESYYFTRSRKLRWIMKALHIPCYGFLASSILVIARRKIP